MARLPLRLSMPRLPIPILKYAHQAAAHAMRRAGYRWEPRRSGELQLGLWRKEWKRASGIKSHAPKRFVLVPGFGDTPMSWLLILGLLRPILRKNFDEIVMVDFPGY